MLRKVVGLFGLAVIAVSICFAARAYNDASDIPTTLREGAHHEPY